MLQTLCKFLPHNEQQGFIYFYFILTTYQIFIAVTESTILDHQKVAYTFQSTRLRSFMIERLDLYTRHIYNEMYQYYIPSFKYFMHERIWYTPISLKLRDWNIKIYNELSNQLYSESTKKCYCYTTSNFDIPSSFNIVNMMNISKYGNENLKWYEICKFQIINTLKFTLSRRKSPQKFYTLSVLHRCCIFV